MKDRDRIAVTGLGIVSPRGIGWTPFQAAIESGEGRPRAIGLFDTAPLNCRLGHEVSDFDHRAFIDERKLNQTGRCTRFLAVATLLALRDAGLESPQAASGLALLAGTAYGTVGDLVDFEDHIAECPRAIDPLFFQNSVTSAPAGFVSLLFGLTGHVATLSSGLNSGMEAVIEAAEMLKRGEAGAVLAAGFDALCPYTYLRLAQQRSLSGSVEGDQERSAPFDRRRNGFFLGEGATVLVLEREREALARGGRARALLASWESRFQGPDGGRGGEAAVIERALQRAGLEAGRIDYVSASANGSREGDRREAAALGRVFGGLKPPTPVAALKSMTGECGGGAAPSQIAAAALSMRSGRIPPTPGFGETDEEARLEGLSTRGRAAHVDSVLVDSFADPHSKAAVVVRRPAESRRPRRSQP